MKKIIFTITGCCAFLLLVSSCSKKTVAFTDPGNIEWKTSEEAAPNLYASTGMKPDLTVHTSTQAMEPVLKKENKAIQKITQKTKTKDEKKVAHKEEVATAKVQKKLLKKELKSAVKASDKDISTLLLVIIAILLPPIAVGLVKGWTSGAFFLNILLWLLFYIPGLIHALIIIFNRNHNA